MIQGLILAAGKGRRLGGLLNGKPKGLLTVGDRTLIEHQVSAMRACGIRRIGIVVGHGAHYVKSELGDEFEFIENADFATTNSLYSLWLARHWVDSSLLMANSDLLADVRIFKRVVQSPGSVLAYDSSSGADAEEMKVTLQNGRVAAISKSIEPDKADGESIGLIKFDQSAARQLFEAADGIVRSGSVNDWSPAAVSAIAQRAEIRAVDIADLPWTEIDFPADLHRARTSVWDRMRLVSGERPAVAPPVTVIKPVGGAAFARAIPMRGPMP